MDWNKEYFYHYTSFESAIKIIASRTLLFSKINRLNDINESCGPTVLYLGLTEKEICDKEELLSKYIQVSLTMDTPKCKGFDIPAMWGHYASRGHGVCLVFDKDAFIASLNNPCLDHRPVIYEQLNDLNEILYDKNHNILFDDFIRYSREALFFHKTPDWSYEQEYRVIAISDEIPFLDIRESLEAIILYNRKHVDFLNSCEYKSLSKIGHNLDIYRYIPGIFNPCDLFDVDNHSIRPELTWDFSLTQHARLNE